MPSIAARLLGAIAAAPILFAAPIAAADPADPELAVRQRMCLPHDGIGSKLRLEFGEKIIGQGISGDGTLVEIFMAPDGMFTVIKTSPQGTSCVVDFGDGWRTLNQLEQVGFTPDDL